MADSRLPTEVELIYEVMPCNAMRTSQEPLGDAHACTYFRKWGTYHSFDYKTAGPPPTPGIEQPITYVGRSSLLPEVLSGCRKAPIVAVGINPNLPGWYGSKRGALNPLFDSYKQYAHYFRYRAVAKLQIPRAKYQALGGGPTDTPFSRFELDVPEDGDGARVIPAELDPQSMYRGYQGLLNDLAERMAWTGADLTVGEDLAYMNMVACPSARWTTRPIQNDPNLPPMTNAERDGIVSECFRERRYFLRQLFQSLPPVLIVFSQSTANAFINEMSGRFTEGAPQPNERVDDLLDRRITLRYGRLADGTTLEARVIFSPHITGNPDGFDAVRAKVLDQLVAAAQDGLIRLNAANGRLQRGRGACVFCTMLEIGPCDYESELEPLVMSGGLLSDKTPGDLLEEKRAQLALIDQVPTAAGPVAAAWSESSQEEE
jgi:hypothetical protein